MSSPIPFMVRRARLIRGETQGDFAFHMGVDPATVSRWETSRIVPTPFKLSEIRRIIRAADPCHSEAYISAAPTIKYVCNVGDFSEGLMVSQGLADAIGTSREEILADREIRWYEEGQRVNDAVHADSRWLRGEIAFFEAQFKAHEDMGKDVWWRTIGAPIAEVGAVLWEGVLEPGPKEFWVKLTPFEEMDDDA